MRKIISVLLLFICFYLTSCTPVEQTETYIFNIKEENYIITWDEDVTATMYYINVTSSVSDEITFTTNETKYNLTTHISSLEKNFDEFNLTIKVKSNTTTSVYKDEVIINVKKELPTLLPAETPTNLKIEDSLLTWDKVFGINQYEIEISINDLVETVVVSDNYFNLSNYFTEEGTYSLRVKSLKTANHLCDSEYSNSINYEYTKVIIEKEIFTYDFTKIDSLPSGFSVTNFAKYADKSIKFNTSKFYLTTSSFVALKSFSVTATIKGNGCSGNATITFYGLDNNNNVLETHPITYTITNSKHDITAEFSNINVTKIKIEYTTKATGNFGLYSLSANHDENSDKITSISVENYQTNYQQNQPFDYTGDLIVNYKSGIVQTFKLNDLKDELKISKFTTESKGTYIATISYKEFTTNVTYNVTYNYDAYYEYADDIKIYTFDLNDELNNMFIMLSLTKEAEEINILFDYNKTTSSETITKLLSEVALYTEHKINYFYSVNNKNLFNNLKYEELQDNTEYNFSPDVYVTSNNTEFNIDIYGYNYYFTTSTITKTNKIDILQLNNDIDTDILKTIDPTHVILQEGTINNLINNGMNIYTYNDQIYQYSPTLNDAFYYTFTRNSFAIDGDNVLELSSHTAWSDAETNGLHHKSLDNYVYRISYYGDISNLYGEELLNKVKDTITKTHTTLVNYAFAKTAFKQTDSDPLNPGKIITFYSNTSIDGTWENGITWNREHVWPKSLSGGIYNSLDDSDKNAGTDLHHIRPALTSINSSRGNKPYGTVTNEKTFYPGDEFIGDTARILLYLSVRYDMNITGLKVCEDINLLLSWNNTDKVDNLERNRNNQVQTIQGNYNPFIDNPWIADRIWK